MLISPKVASAPVQSPPASTALTPAAQERRERAIARLSGNASPQGSAAPVQNANAVAPEEMGAIKAPEAAAEEPSAEAAAPEVPAAPPVKEETPLSSQYAQLARKEKAMRMQAQQVKAQEAAIAAREAKLAAREAAMDGDYIPKERLSKEYIKVLQEQGISYDQITQDMLNQPTQESQVISRLEAKIAALEAGQEEAKKSSVTQQENAYKQAVANIKNEAKQLVYSSDEYETVKATNSVDDVVELITETFKSGMGDEYPPGTLLTVEQAAKLVEEHLEEEAYKLAQLNKIQKRLAARTVATGAAQPSPAKPGDKDSKQQPAMKTLTNAVGATRKLSPRDRAILAMKGELKS